MVEGSIWTWAVNHWNDLATILSLGFTGGIFVLRWKESKRERGNPILNGVMSATYRPNLVQGEANPDEYPPIVRDGTKFEIKLDVGNDGREGVSIIRITIEILDEDDTIEISTEDSRLQETGRTVIGPRVGISDQDHFERDGDIQTSVTLVTSHGDVSETVLFSPEEDDDE